MKKMASMVTTLVALSTAGLLPHRAAAAEAQPADCAVSLQASAPSPHLVGERIVSTATAVNCGAAPVYQFTVAAPPEHGDGDGDDSGRFRRHPRFAMARDFSLDASFAWAPMQEGRYLVRVKVKDGQVLLGARLQW